MVDEKFVDYIDILGFKDMVSKNDAGSKIKSFYQSIHDLWKKMNFVEDNQIKQIEGLVYSDSLIIYTTNDSKKSLVKILYFIREFYKKSLFKHKTMLRGGLAKGKFNVRVTVGFNNLDKYQFFGRAFIDAYELESGKGIKGRRFVFGSSINGILKRNGIQQQYPAKKLEETDEIFDFLWITKEDLTKDNNKKLNIFYEMAQQDGWSEQYTRTLDIFCLIADVDKYYLIKQKSQNHKIFRVRVYK